MGNQASKPRAAPLFPEYLSWKYSQFDYTVDNYGIVCLGDVQGDDARSVAGDNAAVLAEARVRGAEKIERKVGFG